MLKRLRKALTLLFSLAAFFFLFSQTPTQAFIPQNHAEVKNQIQEDYAQPKGELSPELHWLKVSLRYDYVSGAAVGPNSDGPIGICFLSGTPVHLTTGTIPIEKLLPGSSVQNTEFFANNGLTA